ncbi:MAG: DCC1-like thiol-disulfide oxidoreductase family protein [Ekhidna sp.]|uniref:DCC1-like thiol-disulfide oxidoreductase family protein n=1 Tax=Ekhidna sp. TaxID=2608089 RepID=UPI0032EB4CA3
MNIIGRYFSWIDHLLTKQVDATGLSLFRILYSLVLCCEIGQIIFFRHLIYDKVPFLIPSEINMLPGLIVWFISVVFILFGFYTKRAALVNYVLSLVFIGTIKSYEYHVFYIYIILNFLLIFLESDQNHSIDRLRRKIRFSTARREYIPSKTVAAANYYAVLILGIGFFYFDSVFYKYASDFWTKGLGMWLPASIPFATHVDTTLVLNNKWFVLALGYLTLIFETIFLFTFDSKKLRLIWFLIGTGLHVGIIIVFPIPWFGLCMLSMYLLMIPFSFWKVLGKKLRTSTPTLKVFFNQECPLCNRTRMTINHFDYFGKIEWCGIDTIEDDRMKGVPKEDLYYSMHAITKRGKIVDGIKAYLLILKRIPLFIPMYLIVSIPGIYHLAGSIYRIISSKSSFEHCTDQTCGYVPPMAPKPDHEVYVLDGFSRKQLKTLLYGLVFGVFILLQINASYQSYLRLNKKEGPFASKVAWQLSKTAFGITTHGLFTDNHFNGYNHNITVEAVLEDGRRFWLPFINKDGTVGNWNYSFVWAKWTFRINGPEVIHERLKYGIRDFSTFWAVTNDYDPKEIKFNIYVRPLQIPTKWEKDFLKRQKQTKWEKVGQAYWEGDRFIADYPEIETIKFE